MTDTPLAMHDALLLSAPDGVNHDRQLCSFCVDWSLSADGIPSGFGRLSDEAKATPYGDVDYADPGYQSDKVKRYPVDTEAHARAAWDIFSQEDNAGKYTSEQRSKIKGRIKSALARFGVSTSDGANASEGVITTDSDAVAEGGTNKQMDTITQETHEALLEKALRDGVAALETEKAELVTQVTDLTDAKSKLEEELASLKAENERVNGELDKAQVELKTAADELAAIKADVAAKAEAEAKAEVAAERASQVRNLGLFTEEYISEKAALWASQDEAAWTERLEEWKAVKGATPAAPAASETDVASAMSGTNHVNAGQQASARRAILGLS